MKKLTRREKERIDKQLKKKSYSQGGHTVNVSNGNPVTVIVEGRTVFLPSGRRLPVPEEWWV
jgi:chaperone required for assembly of F1-ATPase